MRDYKASL